MKKKQIFWLVIAVIMIAVIVFLKVAPIWVSLTGIIALGCGIVIGCWGKMFYDKYIKEKEVK